MNNKISGKYFGTEIDEKWWKRYTENNMFARGNGKLTFDEQALFFLRLLTNEPMHIDFTDIIEIKVGKWHSGQWGGGKPIMKIIWKKNNQILSSGFSISKDSQEIEQIISELKSLAKLNT